MAGAARAVAVVLGLSALGAGSSDEAPRGRRLRGGAPAAAPADVWRPLGPHRVAEAEGVGLLTVHGDLDLCKQICSNYEGCRSFAYCSGACYLKDGDVTAASPSRANEYCTTYFLGPEPAGTTTAAPQASEENTSGQVECFPLQASLEMNQAQRFEGNVEAGARGSADLLLCTNGTMLGSLVVEGVHSEIIATHIHHCEGGDSPQTRTGVLCSGPPVVNFCGDNAAGLIADGVNYAEACGSPSAAGVSRTSGMRGSLVPQKGTGTSAAELVRDMAEHPNKYYVNVHTTASYMHFYPHHEGACRGPLRSPGAAAPESSTTPAPASAVPADRCYSMFSQMSMNELQRYKDNPDSAATGYADVTLCTNGTMRATALMFGGASGLIAMHIHQCEGGDSPQTRTADLCNGPPVVNFCGSNAAGLIADGHRYSGPCTPWSAGASRTAGMAGAAVDGGGAAAVARLVDAIAQHPERYYFNAHTEASYMHWYPHHNGMARGPMERSTS